MAARDPARPGRHRTARPRRMPSHCQALRGVSTNLKLVADFGIDPENAFGFWNWVGGRYSVDSAVGLSLIIALAASAGSSSLAGFHDLDEYFQKTPLEKNVVALMGLLNVWYVNFYGAESHAVLPYNQYLHRFAAYLQQLTMESNGKSVRWGRQPRDLRHRRDLLGRTGHPMASTPSISSFTRAPYDSGGFHRLREHAPTPCATATRTSTSSSSALPRSDQGPCLWQDGRRGPRRGHGRVDGARPRLRGQPSHDVDLRCGAHAAPRSASSSRSTSTSPSSRARSGASTPMTSGASSWASSSPSRLRPAFHDDEALAAQDASTQALIAYYRAHRK